MVVSTMALVLFGAGLGVINAHGQGPRAQPGVIWAGVVMLVAMVVLVVGTDDAPGTIWLLPGLFLGWFFTAGHLWRGHPELQDAGLLSRCWTAMNHHRRLREYRYQNIDA